MTDHDFDLLAIRDPRLAVHATSPLPAWLWSIDGGRILWANPAGAQVFGARNGRELAARPIGPADPQRRQVLRLAGRLSPSGTTRLERLTGFGAALGGLATCACTRLTFDGEATVLLVAIDQARRVMPMDERLARIVETIDMPAAAFSRDGDFAGANESARALPDAAGIAGLAAEPIHAEVMREGRAEMRNDTGRIVFHRVGTGADTAIVALISPVIVMPTMPIHDAPPAAAEPLHEVAPATETQADIAEAGGETAETPDSSFDRPEPDQTIALLTEDPGDEPLPDISAVTVEDDADDEAGQAALIVAPHEAREAEAPSAHLHSEAPPEPHDEPLPVTTPVEKQPADNAAIASEPAIAPEAPSQDIAEAPAAPAASEHDSPASLLANEPPPSPRHHPLRFMWQMDEHGRFSFGSDEFTRLIGVHTAAAFGRLWTEINEVLGLDPEGKVAKAIATHDTWSGIVLQWPVDGSGARLPVELSGLPIHDRDRQFRGYRGFGVCRDIEGLARLAAKRRDDLLFGTQQSTEPPHDRETTANSHATLNPETQAVTDQPSLPGEPERAVDHPVNVVPFRPASGDAKPPTLTPVENNAFAEIARQLSARLEANGVETTAPAEDDTAADDLDAATAIAADEAPASPEPETAPHVEAAALSPLPSADHVPAGDELQADELAAILDTTAEGILIFDSTGTIQSCNRSAEALFGLSDRDIAERPLTEMFALESQRGMMDYFQSVKDASAASLLDHGRDVLARARDGGTIPVSVTIGRTRADGARYFAVFRDRPPARPADSEAQQTKRANDRVAVAKADLLSRISHEVRTPVNAIIGFAEVMIDERFGALGNERYVEYMKDIRASGERVIAIIDDLLNLSRIESGRLDLTFTSQDLNSLLEQCVAAMQAHANRERIIIRTSLAHALPTISADARALRQIALNLIGNSIHLANAGGQVIVSTAVTDFGDVVLRVRDTGHGLNDNEIAAAMAPFRTPAAADSIGESGSNLSLTKALVEANRAQFHIKSAPNSGTLVEVVFARENAAAQQG
ncbi:MAG: PAS domain S-box protein [Afipia sp.]